jgi:hypothetical protein
MKFDFTISLRSRRQLSSNALCKIPHLFAPLPWKRAAMDRKISIDLGQHQNIPLLNEQMPAPFHHIQGSTVPGSSSPSAGAKRLVRNPDKKRGTIRRHVHPSIDDDYTLHSTGHLVVGPAAASSTGRQGRGRFFGFVHKRPKKLMKGASAQ